LDDGDNMAPEPTATTGGGEGQGAGAAEEAVAPAGAGDEDERDRGGGGGGKLLQVRKRSSLSPTFMLNRLLILPRQARDKHRENSKTDLLVAQLPCGHVYHWDCGRQWLQAHVSCPECRARVQPAPAGSTGADAATAGGGNPDAYGKNCHRICDSILSFSQMKTESGCQDRLRTDTTQAQNKLVFVFSQVV
jgi:hypothetical protein